MKNIFYKNCIEIINNKFNDQMVKTTFNLYTLRQTVLKKDPFMLMSGGAYFKENIIKDISGEIHICIDIPKYREKYFGMPVNYREEKFLNSIDVPVNQYSIFLIILLHEVGHANVLYNFQKNKLTKYYKILSERLKKDETLFEDLDEEIEINYISIDYYTNFIEARADIFAMENFYPIWKEVNQTMLESDIK